jgi:hypothetical protein
MSAAVVYVVPRDNSWSIRLNERFFGAFPDRQAAVEAAIAIAQKGCEKGLGVSVLVHEFDDWYRMKWDGGNSTACGSLAPPTAGVNPQLQPWLLGAPGANEPWESCRPAPASI